MALTYSFKDTNTNEIVEITMRVSEYDNFIISNPHMERYFEPGVVPNIVSGVGGIKNDSGWKEVLSKVAESHPNSELGKKTINRSSKQVKIDNIVNKYKK